MKLGIVYVLPKDLIVRITIGMDEFLVQKTESARTKGMKKSAQGMEQAINTLERLDEAGL